MLATFAEALRVHFGAIRIFGCVDGKAMNDSTPITTVNVDPSLSG